MSLATKFQYWTVSTTHLIWLYNNYDIYGDYYQKNIKQNKKYTVIMLLYFKIKKDYFIKNDK